MKKGKLIALIMLIIFCFGMLNAGDFEETLSQMLEKNAKLYAQPLVTGFGSSMNSGLYKKVKCKTGILPIPIGFDIGIITSVSLVSDEDLTFDFDLSSDLDLDFGSIDPSLPNITVKMSDIYNETEVPTVCGEQDEITVTRKTQTEVVSALVNAMPGTVTEKQAYEIALNNSYSSVKGLMQEISLVGSGIPVVPSANIQLNVRVPFGIEFSLRGAPEYESPDVGKIQMIGFGVRKSVPVPIIDVSAGAFYQTLSIGDVFEAKNINIHAEVGKTLGVPGFKFSPYLGVGMDKSTVDLSYTIVDGDLPGMDGDQEVSFTMEGENTLRVNVGFSLQMALLYLHSEYSVGKYQTASLSVGFIFK